METMTVIIEGKEVERKVAYYTRDDHESERGRMQRQYPVPETLPNERCFRTVSGDTIILKVPE